MLAVQRDGDEVCCKRCGGECCASCPGIGYIQQSGDRVLVNNKKIQLDGDPVIWPDHMEEVCVEGEDGEECYCIPQPKTTYLIQTTLTVWQQNKRVVRLTDPDTECGNVCEQSPNVFAG